MSCCGLECHDTLIHCMSCCRLECHDTLIHCMSTFVLCIPCMLIVGENGNFNILIYCCIAIYVCMFLLKMTKSELKCGTIVNYEHRD